jgi:hypothetical protein
MAFDQKRPPPTRRTRAAVMSPGWNAAACRWIVRWVNASRFTGPRGWLTVEVYRPSRLTGSSCLPAVEVVWQFMFTGRPRSSLPAVHVYRPSKFTGCSRFPPHHPPSLVSLSPPPWNPEDLKGDKRSVLHARTVMAFGSPNHSKMLISAAALDYKDKICLKMIYSVPILLLPPSNIPP